MPKFINEVCKWFAIEFRFSIGRVNRDGVPVLVFC